ncbi:MAG: PD40 domain-containing protein [Deltaproteobacteria bacterium]|nr:PD40 domain-containing protein [Deltaproteobacteria bacterium]
MRTWKIFGSLGLLSTALVFACNNTSIGSDGCADPAADPSTCVPVCTEPNGCGTPMAPEFASINISPSPVMISASGQPVTQQLSATGTRPDGTTSSQLIGVSWSAPANAIGTVDANGLFTANGTIGGTVEVTASYVTGGVTLTKTVSITVNIAQVAITPGTDPAAASNFTGTPTLDLTKAAGIVYPLNDVMMPQNVYPANIQWTMGAVGDIFRVTITKPNMTFTAYVGHNTAAFTSNYLVDTKGWSGIAQSNTDDPAVLTVDRWEKATGKVWSGNPVKMNFAKGSLLGTIYYWDINVGKIRKIQDGTATATDLLPNPPASPSSGERCVGCHTVSRDGRYMVGRLGGGINYGGIFDLTANLNANPAPTTYPVTTATQPFYFSSFSPDAKRLVVVNPSGGNLMYFIDTATGKPVPLGAGSSPLPTGSTYPNWSPDGKSIAIASEANGDGTDLSVANLSVLPVTGPDTVGPIVRVHTANTVAGATQNSYPTWSPDSKWIAFQNGTSPRSDNQRLGSLFMISPTGTNLTKLVNAMGGQTAKVFFPNFSPFNVGGYFWVSFISERDYGNNKVGTAGTSRQQLWVAAIKNAPVPGQDPSFVPYWLPGQNVAAKNISAYWAPVACRQDGAAADVSTQCCSGVAVGGKCVSPQTCIGTGQTCGGGGCCAGLVCSANICQQPVG